MRSQTSTFIFFVYLFISSNHISIAFTSNLLSKSRNVDSAKLASVCFKGLAQNIPPDFCWKRGGDVGIIPTGCPKGYFRSLALCYEYCASGYRHVLGVCWHDCSAGYADHGMSCYNNLFRWYFKHSYIPNSITNFSSLVPCPEGMYRFGALCYRNCNNIGLENCGIGACASTSQQCASSIIGMVSDIFQGIADAIMFVISFGGSTGIKAAKSAIKKGVEKIGKQGVRSALNTAKRALTGKYKDIIISKAIESAKTTLKEKGKEILGTHLKNFSVESYCKYILTGAATKIQSVNDINTNTLISSVDIFNVHGIVKGCEDTSSENNAINCAKNVLQGGSALDPTGLFTISAAFLHPICDVPAAVFTPSKEVIETIKAFEEVQTVEDNCIVLYENCNYKGRSQKYCSDTSFMKEFNDIASSLITGKNASGVLYEHSNYEGRSIPFGPSSVISCFEDFKTEEMKLNNLISSVRFGADKCVIINYIKTEEKNKDWSSNIHICGDNPDVSITIPIDLKNIRIIIYRQNVSATLYEGKNYTGRSWQINERGNLKVNQIPFHQINSVKYSG